MSARFSVQQHGDGTQGEGLELFAGGKTLLISAI